MENKYCTRYKMPNIEFTKKGKGVALLRLVSVVAMKENGSRER